MTEETPTPHIVERIDGKAEYIITLKDYNDLEAFYYEMENHGSLSDSTIPERAVECVERRPISRNTHYMLTRLEEHLIRQDPRVESVTLSPEYTGARPGTFSEKNQYVRANKSGLESEDMINWGLLRCQNGVQTTDWGWDGNMDSYGTLSFFQTGKNVDVVICDAGDVYVLHPEYAVNIDGTGGTRCVTLDWYNYDPVVKGRAKTTNYFGGFQSHSGHVSGTAAGNRQGWARDANIYNISYAAGAESGSTSGIAADPLFKYSIDYIRAFHNSKPINPATGRKNPTIVNNSWGMSLFPGQWLSSSVTAVYYRGVKYEATSGTPGWNGYYGIFSEGYLFKYLENKKNGGSRIRTYYSGGVAKTSTTGTILTSTMGAIQTFTYGDNGDCYTEASSTNPPNQYVVTVQGPAVINVSSGLYMSTTTGTATVSSNITIKRGSTIIISQDGISATGTSVSTNCIIQNAGYDTIYGKRYILYDSAIYTIEINLSGTSSVGATGVTKSFFGTVVSDVYWGGAVDLTSITNQILGPASLTASTTPTVGNNNDGFWTLSLPFNITYMKNNYSTIYVSTNGYISFDFGSSSSLSSLYSGSMQGAGYPHTRKIAICAQDMSTQRIYYGTEGSAPNRTYRVRVEASLGYSGILGSPTVEYEVIFYENNPETFDIQMGANRDYFYEGYFSYAQLANYGFSSYNGGYVRIPFRLPSVDADIKDAIADGIIMVGAAGNGGFYHAAPGDQDWDNYVEMGKVYPESLYTKYYYHRGTSPTANDSDINNICVGAVDYAKIDKKRDFSDHGPGVDIWSPGTFIMSPYPSTGVYDNRNGSSYTIGKISGTSMASPQVTGVLACALEIYPTMNQADAKKYITSIASKNQLTDYTSLGFSNPGALNGAPNLFLYYKRERKNSDLVIPKQDFLVRPTTGKLWPRSNDRKNIRLV